MQVYGIQKYTYVCIHTYVCIYLYFPKIKVCKFSAYYLGKVNANTTQL